MKLKARYRLGNPYNPTAQFNQDTWRKVQRRFNGGKNPTRQVLLNAAVNHKHGAEGFINYLVRSDAIKEI